MWCTKYFSTVYNLQYVSSASGSPDPRQELCPWTLLPGDFCPSDPFQNWTPPSFNNPAPLLLQIFPLCVQCCYRFVIHIWQTPTPPPSPDLVSGISYLRLCAYHRHLVSFKASWRQYFFARPTRHDSARSWLLRLLELRLTNFPTYLLTPLGYIWDMLLRNINETVCATVFCTIIMVHKVRAVLRGRSTQDRALILLGLAVLPCKHLCIFVLHSAIYVVKYFWLRPFLYLLVSRAWWDWPLMW